MSKRQTEYAALKTGFPVADVLLPIEQTYRDNPLIKKADVQLELTHLQVLELIKCANDPIYFCRNYVKIRTTDGKIQNFEPYPFQIELIKMMVECRFVAALFGRQQGKTTTVGAVIAWYGIFNENQDMAILANKGDQAQEIVSRIQLIIENLPFFMQPGVRTWNKRSMDLGNGTRIFSAATSASSIRGKSVSFLYIDEAAHIANDIEFYESTYPVISAGENSRVVMTTTPKGARGMFYHIYTQGEKKLNDYATIKSIWSDVPGRGEKWKATTLANIGGMAQWLQEFCCEFIGSSGTLINPEVLQRLEYSNPLKESKDGHTKIYEEARENRKYIAIADCAEGVGQDSSVLTVIDVEEIPYRVVAKYKNNTISPLLFPYTIVSMCQQYGGCPVLVESNNDVGGQVTYILKYELEYEGTLGCTSDRKGRELKIGGYGAKPGVKTTRKVKNVGCSNLKTLIEMDKLLVVDEEIIQELGTFIEKNNSYEADDDCHDDTVMTLVLFSWLVKQTWFMDYSSSNIVTNLYDTVKQHMEEELLPFGFMNNAADEPEQDYREYMGIRIHEGGSLDDFFNN
uniref:Terminase DNA packaging enzyme large subunit n=1 Tax=Pseudomonas phage Cygsa01 TaxID=3138529 RepID=A0AAU6W3A6_9VIRU